MDADNKNGTTKLKVQTVNTLVNKTCIACANHLVIDDRDPDDWFCDDDVAVVCKLVKNDKQDLQSKYQADHSEFKVIQCGIRPYRIRQEAIRPKWCPLSR